MKQLRPLFAAALIALPFFASRQPVARANWGVFLGVLPNPMHADEPHAEVLAKSRIGAVCLTSVVYQGTHERATVFPKVTIKSNATVVWRWHMRTKAHSAEAIVSCTYKGVTLKSTANFAIVQH